jgi:hypothetical protein
MIAGLRAAYMVGVFTLAASYLFGALALTGALLVEWRPKKRAESFPSARSVGAWWGRGGAGT